MFTPAYMGRKRGEAPPKLSLHEPPISTGTGKAIEIGHIRPMYAGANMGHRPFPNAPVGMAKCKAATTSIFALGMEGSTNSSSSSAGCKAMP
jgi:hypothetical protein